MPRWSHMTYPIGPDDCYKEIDGLRQEAKALAVQRDEARNAIKKLHYELGSLRDWKDSVTAQRDELAALLRRWYQLHGEAHHLDCPDYCPSCETEAALAKLEDNNATNT